MAKCIYNKGCDAATVLPDFPAYVQPLGILSLTQAEYCTALNLKRWTIIDITYECSGIDDFFIVDYDYLESIKITGSRKYDYANSLTLESKS